MKKNIFEPKPINMRLTHALFAMLCFASTASFSQQSISAKIIDSTARTPIPFATIALDDNTGVISNDFGEFNITINKEITSKDSLSISCLGYEKKQIAIKNFSDSLIVLRTKAIDLSEVLITNKNYTIKEILEKIKANLADNYDLDYHKRKLFYRESFYTNLIKGDVKVKKTTIPEFNQSFIDSVMQSIPKNTDDHTEILGELYGKIEASAPQKMEIFKASHLYDKKNEITFENYEKRFNDIIKKHVKRDSYFKIKSGWFGTKEEIDSSFFDEKQVDKETAEFIEEKKEREKKRKENFLKYRKRNIHGFENNTFLKEDTDLNFIEKSNRYEFTLLDFAYLNDEFVYTITFKPKRKEDYKGTLYVTTDDFAIVRVDYENVKPLKKFNLLGVSYKEYLKKGTIIYVKNDKGKYTLKYADSEFGERFGIDRPLKIIEKNKHVKGRRKQNELSTNIHFIINNTTKKEIIVFDSSPISETEYNSFTEVPNVTPTYLPKYDPEFWKGYNIIEPNQAIKDFKVLD